MDQMNKPKMTKKLDHDQVTYNTEWVEHVQEISRKKTQITVEFFLKRE